jgi:hypothetical protein
MAKNYIESPSPDVGAGHRARPNDRQFYLDVLNSNECACGRVKHPKFAFCYRCHNKLSLDLQVDLRLPAFRKEFQEAYEQAVKHLEEQGIV